VIGFGEQATVTVGVAFVTVSEGAAGKEHGPELDKLPAMRCVPTGRFAPPVQDPVVDVSDTLQIRLEVEVALSVKEKTVGPVEVSQASVTENVPFDPNASVGGTL
jgi:hypothetical protein